MSGGKFSRLISRPRSALGTTSVQMPTNEGGVGYERDAKSELFLLAVANMVGETSFYEAAAERDSRFVELIHAVTADDPLWTARFIPYLRNTMQMRSASIVAAVEYGKAYRGDPEAPGLSRPQVVASALARADEPAEMLAYFQSRYGRSFPTWLKRGINLKLGALYSERAALKYDGQERVWRFGDVIALTHPEPETDRRRALYRFLLEARYERGAQAYEWLRREPAAAELLPMLASWDELNRIPVQERRAVLDRPDAERVLAAAGLTWERLSGWLQGPLHARAWAVMIPSMGYMALLRNLRNFEDAGVSKQVLARVLEKLTDPSEVRASRQFPLRFFSAYTNLRSEYFAYALESALELSVQNIPHFSGRTLIMVDCSGSMNSRLSGKSDLLRWEAAALFGLAMAKRCEQVDLYAYSNDVRHFDPAGPLLRTLPSLFQWKGAGQGTQTWQSVAQCFSGQERVVILTDEQAHPANADPERLVDAKRIYTYNLAGYRAAHNRQGANGSYVFGGLTDAGFEMMALIEAGEDAGWPFLRQSEVA